MIALYGNKKINQLLNKLNPAELREDAKQELFLILASMPDEKFMKIHQTPNESGLIFWSIRTLCNMMKSDRSTFARTFRLQPIPFDVMHEKVNHSLDEFNGKETPEIHLLIDQELKDLHWYESAAFQEYIKSGSIVQLSRDTGIPYRSLFKTIKSTREKLKKRVQFRINEADK